MAACVQACVVHPLYTFVFWCQTPCAPLFFGANPLCTHSSVQMWIKVRLAPMCPYLGTISLAFVGPPTIKVQLNPYNTVRLMRIPVLQVKEGTNNNNNWLHQKF